MPSPRASSATPGSYVSPPNAVSPFLSIIWAITIIPLIKYAWIALEFGNSTGEGGPVRLN